MSAYSIIISIVPRNNGELVTRAANAAGAFGGTILMGRGTAASSLLHILGFGDSAKDIVLIVSESDKKDKIKDSVIEAAKEKKQPFGILFTLNASDFFKSGTNHSEENMNLNSEYKLITVIVNKGYADAAMDAARKAGAGGGTIINARGTAKPGDSTFFGVEIVPEKDMILIAAESSKAEGILEAIRTLPCLSKPGSGIAFASPAVDFTVLGKHK
ncbi:MAG: P-II family nitrogen regulator [Treponema sp.]